MKKIFNITKNLLSLAGLAVLGAGGWLAYRHFAGNATIERLLQENVALKQAIENLTAETQIGYAKVVQQTVSDGRLWTTVRFVETDPQDVSRRVLEKEFDIEGDVAHFDALIVRFSTPLVAEGKQRAMYLWRRAYGEKIPPEQGVVLNDPQTEPARYRHLTQTLSLNEKNLFWSQIWSLANDPKRLEHLGISAIYGNVVYRQLKPGLIYVFKINPTGSIYPEIVPDL